jgi:hypothetical protein
MLAGTAVREISRGAYGVRVQAGVDEPRPGSTGAPADTSHANGTRAGVPVGIPLTDCPRQTYPYQ